MRIIDMRPEITPWKDGQHRQVSSWSFEDTYQPIGGHVRRVWHYATLMMEFVGFERGFDHDRGESEMEWMVTPISIGHGSVSDQGGMNQLMSFMTKWHPDHGLQHFETYGYYYYRDRRGGGPRIVNTYSGETVL